jgi:hypothetical protein
VRLHEIEEARPAQETPPFTVRFHEALDPAVVTERVVRNPAYPGSDTGHPLGYHGVPIPAMRRKPGFFAALRESIRSQGVRNPIIVQLTSKGYYLQFGGSRLRAAQAEEIASLPALVVDWTGELSHLPAVTSENWQQFFTDVPEYFEFTDEGIETHYSLERNRRHEYDPAGLAWVDGSSFWLRTEFSWLFETRR